MNERSPNYKDNDGVPEDMELAEIGRVWIREGPNGTMRSVFGPRHIETVFATYGELCAAIGLEATHLLALRATATATAKG